MTAKTTCKKCGQLCGGELKIAEIENDENGHKVVLELRSQTQSEQSLLKVLSYGPTIKQVGNTLVIEATFVTDKPEEATATVEPKKMETVTKKAPAKKVTVKPKDD